MTKHLIRAAALLALAMAATEPAAANPLKSLYTTIELETCEQVKTHADGGAWLCPGIEGYPVYIAEGDLRMFVSVGPNPEKRRAATQTLKAFNSLFKGQSSRATLEWRFVKRDGKVVPYATIQRYYTSHDGAPGEVLVVTRVTETEDCHVAHIDALANSDAIAQARRIADKEARAFDCSREPRTIGRTSRKPI
jgi:hypothetical protein